MVTKPCTLYTPNALLTLSTLYNLKVPQTVKTL